MHHAAQAAARLLHKELPDWLKESQPHLENAARCYGRIGDLLAPLAGVPEKQGYKAFVGDLDKQRAHVDEVLRPVRQEMAAAAEDIQRTLDGIK